MRTKHFRTFKKLASGTSSATTVSRKVGALGEMDAVTRQTAILKAGVELGIVEVDKPTRTFRMAGERKK